jgi:hypothetical protein
VTAFGARSGMLLGLLALPFDVVFHIACQLDHLSYDRLALTCRTLHAHLDDQNAAKSVIQVWDKEHKSS